MPEAISSRWRPSSAWDAVAAGAGRFGAKAGPAGVTLQRLNHIELATLIVRDGRRDAFDDIVSKHLDIAVPAPGRAAFGEKGALVWSAPDQWLAVGSGSGDLHDLRAALRGIAAITDQGDGRALVRIGGPAARRMLAKSIAIDLHPDVFRAGCAATTALAHVSVQLWAEDAAPTYVLAAPRTMAGTIWRCLTASAAEFGYDVSDERRP